MKFLTLVAATLAMASGCIISSDNDGDRSTITLDFELIQLDSIEGETRTTSLAGCAQGEIINIVAVDATETEFAFPFDCASEGSISSAPLPQGAYRVWVELIQDGANTATSESFYVDVNLGEADIVVDGTFQVPTNAGNVQVAWGFTDEDMNEITCDQLPNAGEAPPNGANQIGAATPGPMVLVTIDATANPQDNLVSRDAAPCTAGSMLSNLLPLENSTAVGMYGEAGLYLYRQGGSFDEPTDELGPFDGTLPGTENGFEIGTGLVTDLSEAGMFVLAYTAFCENGWLDENTCN